MSYEGDGYDSDDYRSYNDDTIHNMWVDYTRDQWEDRSDGGYDSCASRGNRRATAAPRRRPLATSAPRQKPRPAPATNDDDPGSAAEWRLSGMIILIALGIIGLMLLICALS